MTQLRLDGCRLEPLGSYVKALGIFRIVAEQLDPTATGWWDLDRFVLSTDRSREQVTEFLIAGYRPTPIVSPWNSGSGFHPKDNKTGIDAIARSTSTRLAGFRRAIDAARRLVADSCWAEMRKEARVRWCRNVLPDDAVLWIDAAIVLTDDRAAFPPLLGTGGNVGRLDFSNNFMQRLADVLQLGDGRRPPRVAESTRWLEAAFDGTGAPALTDKPIGQFDPGAAGGSNAPTGGPELSVVNPWDFVLTFEGTLLFASGAARRLAADARGSAVMPFTFDVTPVGYASAADETTKGELWAPIWSRPARYAEIERLLSEGRAEWNGQHAKRGVDVARAAVTLGIDRGIEAFVRHAFVERMGQAMLAVPVGRMATTRRRRPEVEVLADLDAWVEKVRAVPKLPQGARTALHQLDAAMLAVAARRDPVALQDVLITAAALERVVAQSSTLRGSANVPPPDAGARRVAGAGSVQPLAADRWVPLLDDGSPELRLALALASSRDRPPPATSPAAADPSIAPVGDGDDGVAVGCSAALSLLGTPGTLLRAIKVTKQARGERVEWRRDGQPAVTGLGRVGVVELLGRLVQRRSVEAPTARNDASDDTIVSQVGVDPSFSTADHPVAVGHTIDFVLGALDDRRLSLLLGALLLLRYGGAAGRRGPDQQLPTLAARTPTAVAVVLPFFHGQPITVRKTRHKVRLRPARRWPVLLAASRTSEVVDDALHRLRIARLEPLVGAPDVIAAGVDPGRLLAATAFPLISTGASELLDLVATPSDRDLAEPLVEEMSP